VTYTTNFIYPGIVHYTQCRSLLGQQVLFDNKLLANYNAVFQG
jgi:hypothetical protein